MSLRALASRMILLPVLLLTNAGADPRSAHAEADHAGEWRRESGPDHRRRHTLVYDSIDDQLLLHGGGLSDYHRYFGDTWSLPLAGDRGWKLAIDEELDDRSFHTAVMDPARHRMIVFGGNSETVPGPPDRDVHVLSLGDTPSWSRLVVEGGPGPTLQHSAIWDPVRDRMLVFGGTGDGEARNTVWALTTDPAPAWTLLAVSGVPPMKRYGAAVIYDPIGDRMIVFGGWVLEPTWHPVNDVWELSLGGTPTWRQIDPGGIAPSPRARSAALYDAARHRMLVLGGPDAELWSLDLGDSAAWSEISTAGLPYQTVIGTSADYDPVRDRIVLHGGYTVGYEETYPSNETWTLDLAGDLVWRELTPPGAAPLSAMSHSVSFDSHRNRLMVMDGNDGAGGIEVLACDVSNGFTWERISPIGTPPASRWGFTTLFDPFGDRVILCGGRFDDHASADVWELLLDGTPEWRELHPSGGAPTPRHSHLAVFDETRRRMIVFGGVDVGWNQLPGAWALELGGSPHWTQISSDPAFRRDRASAIYDPTEDRVLAFGGRPASVGDDVWALSMTGDGIWRGLRVSSDSPSRRHGHTAVYDAARQRMVVNGGYDEVYQQDFGDTWALQLGPNPQWKPLAPQGDSRERYFHGAVYDPNGDRMIVFGGFEHYMREVDGVWVLQWGAPTAAPENPLDASPHALRCAPNPFSDRLQIRLAHPTAGAVRVDVFDIGGRRVRTLFDGRAGVGTHEFLWDGTLRGGEVAPSGIYFIRSTSEHQTVTSRAVKFVR